MDFRLGRSYLYNNDCERYFRLFWFRVGFVVNIFNFDKMICMLVSGGLDVIGGFFLYLSVVLWVGVCYKGYR